MPARISVVIAADLLETASAAIASYRRQTVAHELELVLVSPSSARVELGSERDGFAHARVVEVSSVTPLAAARAAGVRAARAPLVMIGETHAFPRPAAVEALVRAHDRPWAGVMPALRNANPDGAVSWSNLLLTYGRWLGSGAAHEVDEIATYNGCFRRDLLLGFGNRLDTLLEPGSGLVAELRARGHRFLFEPAAEVDHVNVSLRSAWMAERYLGGRLFAITRTRTWPTLRRLAYCAGAPFIPVVFLARVVRSPAWRDLRRDLPPFTLPALFAGALAWSAGEAAGYALGGAEAEARLAEYELHRARYVARPA